jgi:Transcriptional regulator containing an amidase domain and an AraC-type DNA-binding HTH domain|nr:AraC family transcriptional regulator [uncultured Steroidobacter sp.]
MVDRLESLLTHFAVHARMFHAGALCGLNEVPMLPETGQLHLIKLGPVEVAHDGESPLRVVEPSLLLYPRPLKHRFTTDPNRGADLACANLHFDGGVANPIAAALPPVICVPLAQVEGADGVLSLLFDEAFNQRCGRQALVNRLFEVVLIQVLRHLMESGQIRSGMLAGMGHPKLRHALVAMHEQPAHEWSLEELAETAGMSRTVFANAFRDTVGVTPGAYLQNWRVSLAQQALRQGRSLKMIAVEVGYGSEAALSRAFKTQSGLTPREWKQAQAQG